MPPLLHLQEVRAQHGPSLPLDRQLRGLPEPQVLPALPLLRDPHGARGPGLHDAAAGRRGRAVHQNALVPAQGAPHRAHRRVHHAGGLRDRDRVVLQVPHRAGAREQLHARQPGAPEERGVGQQAQPLQHRRDGELAASVREVSPLLAVSILR